MEEVERTSEFLTLSSIIDNTESYNPEIETVDFKIFQTTDVIGNTIFLTSNTLNEHIAGESGDHPERHYLLLKSNLKKIQKIVEQPIQIYKDKGQHENPRLNFFGLTTFESQNRLKNVKIVCEEVKVGELKIITIFPTRNINEISEGRAIYDFYAETKIL